MVRMPNCPPACMVFSSWSSLPWRMRLEASGVFTRSSSAATRLCLSTRCSSCCETTPRSEVDSMVRTCDCLSDGNTFTMRSTVAAAPVVSRRRVGVQPSRDEQSHFRGGDRDAHGLEVAQLADQDHVRVLAQGGVHCGCETRAVHPDLALADEAALSLVHELDRVFDGEDVPLHAAVDVVDHGRERGGLARTGLAGHQDQSVVGAGNMPHSLLHT